MLDRCLQAPSHLDHSTSLNVARSEVIVTAMNAFFQCGPQAYPADNAELSEMVDGIPDLELDHLEWPAHLDELVDCGILHHLPASPYETGAYLSQLPEAAQPGDVFYMAIPIYQRCLLPKPGRNEGELLLIFDRAYEGNRFLLDADGLAEGMYGDHSKYFKAEQYNNICYILGNDRDEAEKGKIKD